MSTTRRGALGVLCAGTLVLGARLARDALSAPPPPDADYRTLAERIAKTPRHRARLRAIGWAYVRGQAPPPSAAELAQACFPSPEEREYALRLPTSRLLDHLSRQAQEDYRLGRLESVHGWLLSRTEARFAGIVAQLQHV